MAAEPPPYHANPSVTDLGHEYRGENMNYIESKQAAGDNDQQGTIQSPIEKSGVLEPPAVLGYPPQSDYPQQPPSYQLPYHLPTGPSTQPPSYYSTGSNTVNPTVASQQPVAVTRRDQATVPKNYIFLSIINLLVCFFVLGTVALIFSLQVDPAWSSGRYDEARRNSKIAKIFNFIGIGVGSGVWTIIGIFVLVQIVLYFRNLYD